MWVPAKFIYTSTLKKLSTTATLEKVFWEIVSDLDNVPKLQIGEDTQHVVAK